MLLSRPDPARAARVRCLVIADIHANLAAFETVLSTAGTYDEIWCLGDIIGYGPDPNECFDLLRQQRFVAVAGNHDWAAVGRLDLAEFNPAARAAAEWTARELRPENHRFVDSLPVKYLKEGYTLVHGSVRMPIWEYIDEAGVAWDNMALMETRYCLVGHTHVPLLHIDGDSFRKRARTVALDGESVSLKLGDERLILNPGSVGQPRDGDPRSAYMLLDTDSGEATIRRVDYAIGKTQARMYKAGLPDRMAFRLSLGR